MAPLRIGQGRGSRGHAATAATRLLTVLVGVQGLVACHPEDGPGTEEQERGPQGDGGAPAPQARPGLGSSKGRPTGRRFVLPDGLSLVEPIEGDDPFCIPLDQEEKHYLGSGGLVKLCLNLGNATSEPITLWLPAGLMFIADFEENQNGVLIEAASVSVPANVRDFFVSLFTYCANEDREPTEGKLDTYELGPVTDDGPLLEITELVRDETITRDDLDAQTKVQGAVWNATGKGLTAEDRAALAGL